MSQTIEDVYRARLAELGITEYAVKWTNGTDKRVIGYAHSRHSAEKMMRDAQAEVARQGAYDGYNIDNVRIWIEGDDQK